MSGPTRYILAIWVASLPAGSYASENSIPICAGPDRAARKLTCIYDGDTDWEHGVKWRLLDIDAPEISESACAAEKKDAFQSRDRLIGLMQSGYRVIDSGRRDRNKRALVRVQLADGRDAGAALIAEDLAQPWPNKGNVWCRW